jgi:hypothetical protein
MVTVVAAGLDIVQFPNSTARRRQIKPVKRCGLSTENLQNFIPDNY